MNKLGFFTPLMHRPEYELIERYLTKDDTLLEWGSGNSTMYFSGIVKKVISIEHDKEWINNIQTAIDLYDIKNIILYHVPANSQHPDPCRYEQFKDYVEYPVNQKFKFTRVLIDGRARKYCAKSIYNTVNKNTVIFIHDFNRPDYQKTLKYFDVIEQITTGQGIVALKKKTNVIQDESYY